MLVFRAKLRSRKHVMTVHSILDSLLRSEYVMKGCYLHHLK